VVVDTMSYRSTAPTPWTTPLIYPQGVWFAALLVFAAAAVVLAARATVLLVSRRTDDLNREFHPKGAMEEVEVEIVDIGRR
ncbi:MAG: TRAP transporter small permease, partial [Alphaproteobacteria bacterium]